MKIDFKISNSPSFNLSLSEIKKQNGIYSASYGTENKHRYYALVLSGKVYNENGDDFTNEFYKFKYIPNGSVTIEF